MLWRMICRWCSAGTKLDCTDLTGSMWCVIACADAATRKTVMLLLLTGCGAMLCKFGILAG